MERVPENQCTAGPGQGLGLVGCNQLPPRQDREGHQEGKKQNDREPILNDIKIEGSYLKYIFVDTFRYDNFPGKFQKCNYRHVERFFEYVS